VLIDFGLQKQCQAMKYSDFLLYHNKETFNLI